MTFVSYAARAEDVMLWRAFGTLDTGFWIDVGAVDPDGRSVTRALGERGWTGVNVATDAVGAAALRAERPDETTLDCALVDPDDRGAPVSTLGEICRQHAPAAIHLLRVAVTGAAAVLRGGDWARWRPPIVLIAGPAPGADAVLEGLAYRAVWFDGASRFYIAAEHQEALGRHFLAPPHDGDDWVEARRHALEAEADRLRGAVETLSVGLTHLGRANAAVRLDLDDAREADRTLRIAVREELDWRMSIEAERRAGIEARRAELAWRFSAAEQEREALRALLDERDWRLGMASETEASLRAAAAALGAECDALRAECHILRGALASALDERRRAVDTLRFEDAPVALRAVLPAARLIRRIGRLRRSGRPMPAAGALRPAPEALPGASDATLRAGSGAAETPSDAGRPSADPGRDRTAHAGPPPPAARRDGGPDVAATAASAAAADRRIGEAAAEPDRPPVDADRAAPGIPDATLPAPGIPDATVPAPGVPDATVPAPGVPDATVPASGAPDATVPASGVPDATASDDAERPSAEARLVHAVHQYHASSAPGDAVTNSMLLLRETLRSLGLESEIYVRHRDPAHDGIIRLLDEMPRHGDHVLIVRHSLGDEGADAIAALPAPKLLWYHNITPAHLLAADPALARLADLGRAQLDVWRPRVRAAFADSAFNARELARHGFERVGVAQYLFDVASLRRRAAAASPRDEGAPFTILFVGRILPSKGQAELVEAYGLFRQQVGFPCRLVLVGRPFGAAAAYEDEIARRADAHGVGGEIVRAGGVDDATLDAWYARADLYASMSRHEGFGVPLAEAMAHGVPIVAHAAGAIADTLGDAGLVVEGGPDAMAAAMRALATDPARRASLRARGDARLDAFAAPRQLPVLRDLLALAGVSLPAAATPAPDRADALRITVAGHVNGSYSLAAVTRSLALALERDRPGTVALLPVEGEPGAAITDAPEDERVTLGLLAGRDLAGASPHVLISQHYPLWVPPDGVADRAIAYFFWEESLVPEATIRLLNGRFDAVFAPSRFVARALVESGLRIPVETVGYAPTLDRFLASAPDRARGRRVPFTFLHVSSGFPRKGIDVLLQAWALSGWTASDPVRLLIKTQPNPHNDVADRIDALLAGSPGLAPITHIEAELDDDALDALLGSADAVVLPTRGEGFNIPAAEAMARGIPLVVSAEGGHADWISPETALLVPGTHEPAATHLSEPGSLWFAPDPAALATALALLRADPDGAAARAGRARLVARTRFGRRRFGRRVAEAAGRVLEAPRPAGARRIALVSTWKVRCGIAEYAAALVAARPAWSAAALTVLADRRAAAEPGVEPAWERDDHFRPDALARAVARVDPDVLLVQHQPSLFGWDDLALLLADARIRTARRVVAVTLHNTAHLGEVPASRRGAILAGLADADRLIVHTALDLDRLRAWGLGNVVVIPQGALPGAPLGAPAGTPAGADEDAAAPPVRDRDRPEDAAPLIGTYGFLLRSKSFEVLFDAVAILRRRIPGARLRMVTASYGDESELLARALRRRAIDLELEDAIEWHTAFLPRAESLRLLGGCDVIALPYGPTAESSSAALRTAMAAGRPVAVTPVAIFEEARGAVATLPGGTPEAIADGLAALLDDPARQSALARSGADWLAGRDWARIAERTFGMLDGLLGARRAEMAARARAVSAATPRP